MGCLMLCFPFLVLEGLSQAEEDSHLSSVVRILLFFENCNSFIFSSLFTSSNSGSVSNVSECLFQFDFFLLIMVDYNYIPLFQNSFVYYGYYSFPYCFVSFVKCKFLVFCIFFRGLTFPNEFLVENFPGLLGLLWSRWLFILADEAFMVCISTVTGYWRIYAHLNLQVICWPLPLPLCSTWQSWSPSWTISSESKSSPWPTTQFDLFLSFYMNPFCLLQPL